MGDPSEESDENSYCGIVDVQERIYIYSQEHALLAINVYPYVFTSLSNFRKNCIFTDI